MNPDLSSYDVLLLNTSGGKDSQAMLDYLVELAREAGVLDKLVTVHCDLGRMEWPGTRELAQRQAEEFYGLPFVVISRPQGDLLTHIRQRGMFPDAARRYCTSDHKSGQVAKVITALVDERRNAAGWVRNPDGSYEKRKVRILNCLGMRAQESPKRAKMLPLSYDPTHWSKPPKKDGTPGKPHGKRHVERWLPLHGWSEAQVWERIAVSGVPYHPAYDLGMPRLSCSFCVLASKGALIRAAQLRPELAAEYATVEAEIGHDFRQGLPMRRIIELAATTTTPPVIEDWAA